MAGNSSDDFSDEERGGLYKAIYTRRDVRSHFRPGGISDETVARILHAAHHAPSVGFSQPWNFILIRDGATRRRIKESFEAERKRSSDMVRDDPKKRSRYLSFKLEGILESALNLCVTYDPAKFGPFVIGRSSIPETGLYSVCCAIQNLWLAARTEGIGVGWVSILSNDVLREALQIPGHVVPVAYLCLGHVDRFAPRPDLEEAGWLPRLALGDVTYFERWRNEEAGGVWEGMQDMIRGMAADGVSAGSGARASSSSPSTSPSE
ncbi:MAG: 5,6-dimethylbenzimidazole synthase [Nitrosopumilaceae archaeon]|nr:5,6-dimethylbenzimidazole synthase [Nitrosopumilaceae archaeon]